MLSIAWIITILGGLVTQCGDFLLGGAGPGVVVVDERRLPDDQARLRHRDLVRELGGEVAHAEELLRATTGARHAHRIRRYREGKADERVQRGIHISINGIAAGLRNTG